MKKLSVSLSKKEVIFGVLYILVQLFVLPTLLTWGNMLLRDPLSETQLNFAFFALNFIVITVVFRRFLLRNFKMLMRDPWRVLRYAGLGLLLYWVGNFLVSLLVVYLLPTFHNANDQYVQQMTQENVMLMSFGTIILVPVVEETLFRGVVFGSLYQKNRFLGYAVSTVVFSFIHLLGYLPTYTPLELCLSFLQYVPAGLCLAWSYQKADSIWAPVLIHIAVNQMGNLLMR